jgi:23S rRNA (adenine2030-N6)-methyltransferase
MNYRHAFHAGNFADAVKHAALTAVLLYLSRKEAAFAVFDSHAGAGRYDLKGREAKKTGEAAAGVGKLRALKADGALGAWLDLVRGEGEDTYPGSPLIAAKLLRPQDRLIAAEMHPQDAQTLKETLAQFRKARVVEGDGYRMLAANLPPPERRGLVLIDPPFEEDDEFEQMGRAFTNAYRRFATGVYLLWFPLKDVAGAERFMGEVLAAGVTKALRIDFAVEAKEEKLSAAGLLVVNPPFGFFDEMEKNLSVLSPLLGGAAGAAKVSWIVGAE